MIISVYTLNFIAFSLHDVRYCWEKNQVGQLLELDELKGKDYFFLGVARLDPPLDMPMGRALETHISNRKFQL